MEHRKENGRKMAYRREVWKDNGRQRRGVEETRSTEREVEGRWNTEERSGRTMEYSREEWQEDGIKREEWKERRVQKRGVEGT